MFCLLPLMKGFREGVWTPVISYDLQNWVLSNGGGGSGGSGGNGKRWGGRYYISFNMLPPLYHWKKCAPYTELSRHFIPSSWHRLRVTFLSTINYVESKYDLKTQFVLYMTLMTDLYGPVYRSFWRNFPSSLTSYPEAASKWRFFVNYTFPLKRINFSLSYPGTLVTCKINNFFHRYYQLFIYLRGSSAQTSSPTVY